MKQIFFIIIVLLLSFNFVSAQKVSDLKQIKTNINMGTGFSNFGNYQYINPNFQTNINDKLSVNFGVAAVFSNFRVSKLNLEKMPNYQDMRQMSTVYTSTLNYQASERLRVYGSIVYKNVNYSNYQVSNPRNQYMLIGGATYQITPSFSVGFEVRQIKNMSPFDYNYMYPYNF